MAPRTLQLDEGASVVFSGGTGTVRIGPTRPGQTWRVRNVAVIASTKTLEAECRVYLGTVAPVNLLASTETGSSGDSTELDVTLRFGQRLSVVWTGGDATATGTVSVTGDLEVAG